MKSSDYQEFDARIKFQGVSVNSTSEGISFRSKTLMDNIKLQSKEEHDLKEKDERETFLNFETIWNVIQAREKFNLWMESITQNTESFPWYVKRTNHD